jgi:hypothetical protein
MRLNGPDVVVWLKTELEAMRPAPGPIQQNWTLSISRILGPRLGPIGGSVKLLDRFGALEWSPQAIRLDGSKWIPWSDVKEIRTVPLLDIVSESAIEAVSDRTSSLLPPIPLKGMLLNKTLEKTSELLLALFWIVLSDYGERGAAKQVPMAVVHKGSFWRTKTLRPGIFSSAMLGVPQVADSVLATAYARGVPLYMEEPVRDPAAIAAQAEALRRRREQLRRRLAS